MANFDGEYEIRIFYTTVVSAITLEHRHTFDISVVGNPAPGSEFADIDVNLKGGGTEALNLWIADYLVLFRAMLHTTAEVIRVELWFAEEATEDFVFISVYAVGAVGTAAVATVVAGQWTATYRTVDGGVGRFQIMESSVPGDSLTSFPTTSAISNNLMAFVVGATSAVLGRDNSRPVVANKLGLGQNEKLYRKRFRQGS